MDDVFRVYAALWVRAEGQGVVVVISPSWSAPGLAGVFDPPDNHDNDRPPWLRIIRDGGSPQPRKPSRYFKTGEPLTLDELLEELWVLAHEYGHFCSWNGGTRRPDWLAYHATVKRWDKARDAVYQDRTPDESDDAFLARLNAAVYTALSDEDRRRILHEEALGWELGRKTLVDLDVQDLSEYDARRDLAAKRYSYRLGLTPMDPDAKGESAASPHAVR